jgi:hypothetical protein
VYDEILESDFSAAGGPHIDETEKDDQGATSEISAPHNQSMARRSTSLTVVNEDLTRQLGRGDIIIPKLRISQGLSKTNILYASSRGKEGVSMGEWYISTQQKSLGETVYFLPVDMQKSRAYFVTGQGLMCRSFDLLMGQGDPGGLCEGTFEERHELPAEERGCPLRHWIRDPETKTNTPPKCGVTFNYPGLIVENPDDPSASKVTQAVLQLRSTATGAARFMNTTVMNEGGGVWFNVVFELSMESKTNLKGTFFVPVADFYDSTLAEGWRKLRRRAENMARQMGTSLRASIEADDDVE